jgi:hypothetical protein
MSSLRIVWLLLLACMSGVVLAAGAPVDLDFSPGGPRLSVWRPDLSYSGYAQYDARLDKPVKFWRAGLSLAEVFAGVAEQTGVRIDFWPRDDLNRRVRVNLYLQEDEPPGLRELMTQLSWVTDCLFGVEGEGETRSYYLLATSLGQGLEGASDEAQDRQRNDFAREQQRQEAQALSQAEVYAQALLLPRDELIARYHGQDDNLLRNLLDPQRRAAVQYLCSLPKETRTEVILDRRTIQKDLREFSPEDQALLIQAVGFQENWRAQGKVEIRISGGDGASGVEAMVLRPGRAESDASGWDMIGASAAWYWRATSDLGPRDEGALRRLLGERVGAEEQKAIARDWLQRWNASYARRWEARRAEHRSLSPRMVERLKAPLEVDPKRATLLYELQEAVARGAHLSIVSDCFVDLPRRFWDLKKGVPITAFAALSRACDGGSSRDELLTDWSDGGVQFALAWQWGDAGDFLRFRSLYQDIWRAAFLPEEALAKFDAWFAPYLKPEQLDKLQDASLHVPYDVEAGLWLAGHLNRMQTQYGGYLLYGDPADRSVLWAMGLRQYILEEMAWKPLYRLLASLSPQQWQQARGEGLRMDTDLSPSQREIVHEDVGRLTSFGTLPRPPEEYVLRMREGEVRYPPGRDPQSTLPPAPWHIEYVREGVIEGQTSLPSVLITYFGELFYKLPPRAEAPSP